MQEVFRYDLPEEDTIVFTVTDAFRQTPERQLLEQLKAFIARHDQRVRAVDDDRQAEMESLSTDFARTLVSHLESGKTPPQHKAYTLKT